MSLEIGCALHLFWGAKGKKKGSEKDIIAAQLRQSGGKGRGGGSEGLCGERGEG